MKIVCHTSLSDIRNKIFTKFLNKNFLVSGREVGRVSSLSCSLWVVFRVEP